MSIFSGMDDDVLKRLYTNSRDRLLMGYLSIIIGCTLLFCMGGPLVGKIALLVFWISLGILFLICRNKVAQYAMRFLGILIIFNLLISSILLLISFSSDSTGVFFAGGAMLLPIILWGILAYILFQISNNEMLWGDSSLIHCQIKYAYKKRKAGERFFDDLPSAERRLSPKTDRILSRIIAGIIIISYITLSCMSYFNTADDEVQSPKDQKNELNLNSLDDAEAKYELGIRYMEGIGVARDEEKGFVLLKQAAEAGHAKAQIELGGRYLMGIGVAKDIPEGIRWANKAAEQKIPEAYQGLSNYYIGGYGNEYIDYVKAFEYAQKSANAGLAAGKFNLGTCYANGWGCQKDVNRAVGLLNEAAEKGVALAQACLGHCYLAGKGVTKDISRGLWYLNKAAAQKNPGAYHTLSNYYLGDYGNEYIDYVKGFEYAQKSANAGLAAGKFNLGTCYANGWGCQADPNKAIELCKEAARLGEPNAQQVLKNMGIAW